MKAFFIILFLVALALTCKTQDTVVLTCSAVNDTICAGDTITFTATPGFISYSFYNGSSLQQSGASNILISNALPQGSEIYVIANTADSNFKSNTDTIIVMSTPFILFGTASHQLCGSDSAIFYAQVTQQGIFNFSINGLLMQTSTADTFASPLLQPGDSVTVVDIVNGCKSRPFTWIDFAAPQVSLSWNALETAGNVFGSDSDAIYCYSRDTALALQGGSPAGGVYAGNGVTGDILSPDFYSSTTCKCGLDTIYYTYTNLGGCVATATNTIELEDCSTGISAPQEQANFNLYPNPVGAYAFIDFSGIPGSAIINLKDLTGRTLLEINFTGKRQQLDLGNLCAGVYCVSVNTEGQSVTRLLVKE